MLTHENTTNQDKETQDFQSDHREEGTKMTKEPRIYGRIPLANVLASMATTSADIQTPINEPARRFLCSKNRPIG